MNVKTVLLILLFHPTANRATELLFIAGWTTLALWYLLAVDSRTSAPKSLPHSIAVGVLLVLMLLYGIAQSLVLRRLPGLLEKGHQDQHGNILFATGCIGLMLTITFMILKGADNGAFDGLFEFLAEYL